MDLLFALAASFVLLVVAVSHGVYVAYPLLLSMGLVVGILMRRGFSLRSLLQMALTGSRKSISVVSVLLLIGAVTASWMAAGTVPAIVYYSTLTINPQLFILTAFLLTSAVSLLLGTSFGTVGTIGIALMIMANGSGVNPHLIAGAIIAGAYFGDRCSPMSSSANLIAAITQTDLYTNIRRMWATANSPLLLSIVLYAGLSFWFPVTITDPQFLTELTRLFRIQPLVLLPAVVILVLALLQVEVKRAMIASLGVALAIALLTQHYSVVELLKFELVGFSLDQPTVLRSILLGGGLLSMVKVTIVVLISTAFVGIFAETQSLRSVEQLLNRTSAEQNGFLSTCLVGIGSAAFGCTQTIAILLTQQLMETKYKENEKGNDDLALDLENTVVVISPLIPWNIAGLVPATILMTDAGFIPYAFYLYLIPLLNLVRLRLNRPPKLTLCN